MLESSLGLTKGIAINNQQDILYVTEEIQRSEQKLRNLLSFEIDSKGFLSNKTRFSTFFDFSLAGIQVDKFGNIYISRSEKGVITILNPEGKVIREITLLGKNPSAITFGGIDKKTVFVTVNDSLTVQSFRMPLLGQK
jgi:sugar lactone lactonase YvrE